MAIQHRDMIVHPLPTRDEMLRLNQDDNNADTVQKARETWKKWRRQIQNKETLKISVFLHNLLFFYRFKKTLKKKKTLFLRKWKLYFFLAHGKIEIETLFPPFDFAIGTSFFSFTATLGFYYIIKKKVLLWKVKLKKNFFFVLRHR